MPDPRDQARYILLSNNITKSYLCIEILGVGESLSLFDIPEFCHQHKSPLSEKILYEMLDFAITGMVENELCYYCSYNLDKQTTLCKNIDLCRANLFEGLKQAALNKLKGENCCG